MGRFSIVTEMGAPHTVEQSEFSYFILLVSLSLLAIIKCAFAYNGREKPLELPSKMAFKGEISYILHILEVIGNPVHLNSIPNFPKVSTSLPQGNTYQECLHGAVHEKSGKLGISAEVVFADQTASSQRRVQHSI
jgi:hypothetical protein